MTTPTGAYVAALGAMQDKPKYLWTRVATEAEDYDGSVVSGEDLLGYLSLAGLNDPVRMNFGFALARWDVERLPGWARYTEPGSSDRRAAVYKILGLDDPLQQWFSTNYPPHSDGTIVITAEDWQHWYTEERRLTRFYWEAYSRHLREVKHWPPQAIADLGAATDRVVERLADPTQKDPYQSKGLVVGYVQSGKTANFTGVVAKAIDAGYRHVIVLTGMIEMLRGQTQRRLDMELIGIENLLGDYTLEDVSNDPKFDYAGDDDWPDNFMRLGAAPDAAGQPRVTRYTGKGRDYQSLGGAAAQLQPVKLHRHLPLFAPENLSRASAGVFVIKKNATVLKKLAADLKRIRSAFTEIPVLIIDDESDQASVNTIDPAKVEKARQEGKVIPERTAINRAIAELLKLMPRAQYVGYTATPFANVFIDPGDVQDIFPKDFVIGLEPPWGYMGASHFSDIGRDIRDLPENAGQFFKSNQAAYIRDLTARDPDERLKELARALDTFVLTGAVKLYRSDVDPSLAFRHHTMLIHESVRMAEHDTAAQSIRTLWNQGGYTSHTGLERLHKLFETDIEPVSEARTDDAAPPMPAFAVLKPYIGRAISRISEFDNNPVIIVNGDADVQRYQQQLNFDTGSVWRVLVGGAKLSRGFTVEGLTVSYYRRVTDTHDTLAQAGRWFGFRHGYRDLVRVFIGRNEHRGPRQVDLLEAFDAIVQDEDAFREQLSLYSQLVDGKPQVRPIDIPPLVSQHLFWLKPTANNKMFNVELEEQRNQQFGPVGYSDKPLERAENYKLWLPALTALTDRQNLLNTTGLLRFPACLGVVSSAMIHKILSEYKWLDGYGERVVAPWMRFFARVMPAVDDFLLIFPQPKTADTLDEFPIGTLSVVSRSRRGDRSNVLGEPTEPKHRGAAERVTGVSGPSPDSEFMHFVKARRGAVLAYLVQEENQPERPLTVGFRLYLPQASVSEKGPVVQFRARRPGVLEAVVSTIEL